MDPTSMSPPPEARKDLERHRSRGHLRFVLLNGVARFGAPSAVLATLLLLGWHHRPFLQWFPTILGSSAIAGFVYGEVAWRRAAHANGLRREFKPPAEPRNRC